MSIHIRKGLKVSSGNCWGGGQQSQRDRDCVCVCVCVCVYVSLMCVIADKIYEVWGVADTQLVLCFDV